MKYYIFKPNIKPPIGFVLIINKSNHSPLALIVAVTLFNSSITWVDIHVVISNSHTETAPKILLANDSLKIKSGGK